MGLFVGASLLTITELGECVALLLWDVVRHLLRGQRGRRNQDTDK